MYQNHLNEIGEIRVSFGSEDSDNRLLEIRRIEEMWMITGGGSISSSPNYLAYLIISTRNSTRCKTRIKSLRMLSLRCCSVNTTSQAVGLYG